MTVDTHKTNDQPALEARIRATLDASIEIIDQESRSDLAKIRRQVMQKTKAPAWRALNNWVPTSALAFGLLLTLFFVYRPATLNDAAPIAVPQAYINNSIEQVVILDLLNDTDDLAAVSDSDFYGWVDEMIKNEGAGNAV